MSTIAHHAALTAPLLVNGMTVDELLALHHARFGDARMENDGGAAGSGTGDAGAGTGGAGTGTAAPETGTGAAGTGTAGSGAQTGAQQAQQPAAWNPDAWDGKVESLPKAAQKIITDLRTEEGDERVAKKTLDAIVKALNPDAAGDKPDPAQLAQDLAAAQTEKRQTAVELAVYKTASKHSGDPDALLDSRTFLAKVKDLDPSASDFASKVDEAIKSAIADNPKLKQARAAGSSSADHAGGSGEGASRPKSLGDAVASHYGR